MKMIDHNHFICHLILGTFTEYPFIIKKKKSLPNFTSTGIFYQIKALQQSINLSV